ncbi:MAG: D-glycero-beta-D-manno-heptose-7-phosphate kinase [Deltaproteobacteria bacterium]|nr:D-glycero-beta-D-manno-heptose-7-phosphate kinase [Deltaproteobacteria bacterium]
MNENLLNIVKKFHKARILVIGDIMVDHFVYGTVDRISPEAPVPVVQVKSEKLMPGGAANVVNNVSKLGAKVYVAGVVGNDYNGNILKRMVDKETVNSEGILTLDNFQTIIKTRVIAHNQQIVRFDKENNGKFSGGVYKALISGIKKIADDIDAVIISDYGKGLIEKKFFSTVVNFLREKGKFISLDPKVENFKFYKNISILTPNINEAFGGSGIKIKDEKTLIKASKMIFKKVKSDYLLITRGESGMSLFYPDNKSEHLKARAKDVYDVTGAGDTVISTLTVAKSVGAGIFEACYIANAAASIAVSQLGTYAVGVEELMKVLSE